MIRSAGIAVVAIVFCVSSADAATFSKPIRIESQVGNVKRASLTGTYELGPNEVLDRVQMTYNSGFNSGKSTENPRTYDAKVGSFDLVQYKVEFVVRNFRTGRKTNYSSPVYTWGK